MMAVFSSGNVMIANATSGKRFFQCLRKQFLQLYLLRHKKEGARDQCHAFPVEVHRKFFGYGIVPDAHNHSQIGKGKAGDGLHGIFQYSRKGVSHFFGHGAAEWYGKLKFDERGQMLQVIR